MVGGGPPTIAMVGGGPPHPKSSSKKKREPQVLSIKSNEMFDAVKGDLNTEVISKESEGGATISARFDKKETNCNLEEIDVHDVKEIQMMDDDVLPIAHEIIAESELVRDEVELSKSHNPSKPLTSIPVNKEKSPSKSPCIAETFAAARNARKRKVTSEGARGDQNERLDATNELEIAKEKDFVVVAGDTSALKKEQVPAWPVCVAFHWPPAPSQYRPTSSSSAGFVPKIRPIVGLRLGQQLAVAISSPDLAKEVLHTHDKIFSNRPPFQFNELLLSGQNSDIVFSAQCPQAKEDLHSGAVYSQATARAGVRAAGGAVKAAGAGIGHCVSGMSCHVIVRLLQSEGSMHAGAENLHELDREVSVPTMRDLLPALSCLDFLRKRRMRRLQARVQAAFAPMLARRKESNSSHQYDDLLQCLLSREVLDDEPTSAAQETQGPPLMR
ncbi:hypothetical protein L7F22_055883 [Adiantum nelumboides]|nr:hypothetical protein [Adiantum nelumboides]